LDFVKLYELSEQDTTHAFLINVNQVAIEQKGHSIGVSLFSSGIIDGSGVVVSGTYSKKETGGTVNLNKENFEKFYNCINNVYRFIAQRPIQKGAKLNTFTTCSVGEITLAAEYNPNSSSPETLKFYLKVGEEATFSMSKLEFEEIVTTIREVKNLWLK
jgi:hypothetical protein